MSQFILIEITWHMALSSEGGMGLEGSSSITSSNVFTVFGLPACEVPFSGRPSQVSTSQLARSTSFHIMRNPN